ncbi:MAG: L-fucose isomerase, partial [Candidatus Humimicrobiaceae bacterium]
MKEYPKIGIRPTIDGRMNGVRESLEKQTMNMAKSAAKLISDNLKYPDGNPVKCIISDTTIGGVSESEAADKKFSISGVGATLTVTPSWCYGSETMDMDPFRPKAVWGFNGTERPGAVYLAAVLAAHNQKGLPAFGIYGKDVQDANDTSIPEDVKEKIFSFIKASLAVSIMRNKSYLSIGNVSMGIAGSIVNPDFFEDYLGMRLEYADMTEIKRRVDLDIFDREEYEKALNWVKNNLKEGPDDNPLDIQRNRKDLDKDWEFSVKTALICRDMMIGNKKLDGIGYFEESLGHNAIAAGFQGQRQWTDFYPNGDFAETILNSSFDWNGLRTPYILATENDCLNGLSMLFGYFLTNTAQIFSDVRTYWSPDAVKRVTGHSLTGMAKNGIIHLINSGSTALDGTGQQEIDGIPAIKPFWEITEKEVKESIEATRFCPADLEYFRGGGFSTNFLTVGNMPVTMSRI